MLRSVLWEGHYIKMLLYTYIYIYMYKDIDIGIDIEVDIDINIYMCIDIHKYVSVYTYVRMHAEKCAMDPSDVKHIFAYKRRESCKYPHWDKVQKQTCPAATGPNISV